MKNLISNAIQTIAVVILCSISPNPASATSTANYAAAKHMYPAHANTYSWTNRGHASSYVVVLTPRGSGAPIIIRTKNNSISLAGMAKGVYKVTVYGVFSNKNTFAIIQDFIVIGGGNSAEPTKTPPTQDSVNS